MVLPHRVTVEESFPVVSPVLVAAAVAYARARAAELEQLSYMGRQNLEDSWTDDVRSTVLLARQRIHESQEARTLFRDQVREFVVMLRNSGRPGQSVSRHIQTLIELLQSKHGVTCDEGVAAEMVAWATEADQPG